MLKMIFKLKPMLVYQSPNPWTLKRYNYRSLGVVCSQIRKQGWPKQFSRYFYQAVEKYCKGRNITFKVILTLGNAPGHQATTNSLCENVRIIFLPSNTISLLQPMDQGTIHNAWQQITANDMGGVWRRILLNCENTIFAHIVPRLI
jgi:hypothetical protein